MTTCARFRGRRLEILNALVGVDTSSTFSWTFPVRRATSAVSIACLKKGHIFASFGVCRHLVSDNRLQLLPGKSAVSGLGSHRFTTIPSHAKRFYRSFKYAVVAY
jgi:hypothetical protein